MPALYLELFVSWGSYRGGREGVHQAQKLSKSDRCDQVFHNYRQQGWAATELGIKVNAGDPRTWEAQEGE